MWRQAAASTLHVDWWNLTEDKLISLTEAETNFRNNGPAATYSERLYAAAGLAQDLVFIDFFFGNHEIGMALDTTYMLVVTSCRLSVQARQPLGLTSS